MGPRSAQEVQHMQYMCHYIKSWGNFTGSARSLAQDLQHMQYMCHYIKSWGQFYRVCTLSCTGLAPHAVHVQLWTWSLGANFKGSAQYFAQGLQHMQHMCLQHSLKHKKGIYGIFLISESCRHNFWERQNWKSDLVHLKCLIKSQNLNVYSWYCRLVHGIRSLNSVRFEDDCFHWMGFVSLNFGHGSWYLIMNSNCDPRFLQDL